MDGSRAEPDYQDLQIAPESIADAQLVRRLRLSRQVLAASLIGLAIGLVWMLFDGIDIIDVALAAIAVSLASALWAIYVIQSALARHRQERESSIRRLAQGLSRSSSPDSVVDTVISDLRAATDADHVVVARVTQPDGIVEVTLVAAHADAPRARTYLRPEVEQPTVEGAAMDGTAGESAGPSAHAAEAAAEEIARRVRSAYALLPTLATPLVSGRRFLGALILARRGREEWRDGDRRLLTWAAEEVATAFSRAYTLEAAERGARIDVLTGLPNRRYFDEVLDIERPRRRANDTLGIVMIDIDHFKRLNDRYGHAVGDRVLRAVAGAIGSAVRSEDTPARYGGEEFAVLIRRTSQEQAVEVGERIRNTVARLRPSSLGIDQSVTVSVGVAVARSGEVAMRSVVERADQALYRAKRLGRDRVVAG